MTKNKPISRCLGDVSCRVRQPWHAKEQGNSYQIEHDRLFDAIRNDRPFNEAARGAESTMTAILGRMAAYSGRTLTWQQAIHSEKPLTTEAETWNAPPPVQPGPDGGYEIPVPGINNGALIKPPAMEALMRC